MRFFATALPLLARAACAQQGWRIIASDIGGMPLGVSFFEDGLTGVTATSQLLPAGYEVKRSLDGGHTWSIVPDQDLFIFALYNSAVAGTTAVASGMSFVQSSDNAAANFSWASGAPAGGEIVRKLYDASGSTSGFAIMGETEDGSVNGFISCDGLLNTKGPWARHAVMWSNPSMLSIDGSFSNNSWVVVGNVYETATRKQRHERLPPHPRLEWTTAPTGGAPRLTRRTPPTADAATYATEVVVSTDAGATFTTVYSNTSIAALGVACIDATHCAFVGEDGEFAYAFVTLDGWVSVQRTLADTNEGAALVEVAVAPGVCAGGGPAYVAVGGYVTAAGQAPVWYRSCDLGLSWAKDAAPSWPVSNLLVTDIDCQPRAPNGTECWTTLWTRPLTPMDLSHATLLREGCGTVNSEMTVVHECTTLVLRMLPHQSHSGDPSARV